VNAVTSEGLLDVAILGGGMAGLCAGLAAAEAGATVVVLEATDAPGGSMALSGGLVWAPKDLATAREYIPRGRADLQALLCDGIEGAWSWLESLGLPLEPEGPCLKDEMGRGRLMGLGGGGDRRDFAAAMVARLEALGGRLVLGARLTALARVDGGWRATWADGEVTARQIVSATGGFQNNLDMLREFVTTEPERLIVRSNRSSDGFGVSELRGLGAALSNGMSSFYGHSLPVTPEPLDPSMFIPSSQYYSDFTIAINRLGIRFTDESVGVLDEHNAQIGSRQPGATYYLIFDQAIRDEHVTGSAGLPGVLGAQVQDRLALVEQLGGTVLVDDTIEGLAGQLQQRGVPRDNVIDTVLSFNRATDPVADLIPPRTRGHQALTTAPFYAVECRAAITYTMGGLWVDDACRVLDERREPIEGLFAAGADAGGVFQDVYGGGLGWAAVSGRTAGLEAAR